MNVKTIIFSIYPAKNIFEQTQDFQWAGVGMTEVTITQLPRRLTTKHKFSIEWQETETQLTKKKLTKGKCK